MDKGMEVYTGNDFYHYTTVDTLALILKSKRMRFTALANLDDLEEGIVKESNEYRSYFFVSCFSYEEDESIPIWTMYSKGGQGVRIHFKENPFDKDVEFYKDNGETVRKNTIGPYKIIYDLKKKPNIHHKDNESDIVSTIDIGVYKNKSWEFQSEIRYRVDLSNADINNKIREGEEVVPCKTKYCDVPLKEDALKNITITLGYSISPGNKGLVYMMRDYYKNNNWNIEVQKSNLLGKVRAK